MHERNTKGITKLCDQFGLTHERTCYARFCSLTFGLSKSNGHPMRRNSPRPYPRWNWNEKPKLLADHVDIVLLEGDVGGRERYFWIDRAGITELKELLRRENPESFLHVTIKSVDEQSDAKGLFFHQHEKTVAELKAWFASELVRYQYSASLTPK